MLIVAIILIYILELGTRWYVAAILMSVGYHAYDFGWRCCWLAYLPAKKRHPADAADDVELQQVCATRTRKSLPSSQN